MRDCHDGHTGSTDGPPGRVPLHLTAPPGEPGSTDGTGPVAESGTTVVGLCTADRVVLAADRRATVGGHVVTSKRVRKVEPVHPTAALASSGAVGHIQQFVRSLRAEARLYEHRRDEAPSMRALSTLAGSVLGSAPLRVSPLLGGVDADGPRLYSIDAGGGVLSDAYAAGGSGMQVALGVLERQYEPGLDVPAARELAASSVESASERDTASGNGLSVATVTGEGVSVAEHDAASEVA